MGLLISFNLCMTTLFVLSLLIAFLSQTRTEAAATHLNTACPNTTTFTANSTYHANLKHLLAYLSSNATSNLEFYNASAGNSVDTVYGLFLCRGDIPAEACRDCVSVATKEVVDSCPEEKMAVTWYDVCMLRYSNRYIFSTMVPDPTYSFSTQQRVPEPNRFDELVMATMNDLASRVSNVGFGAKKFGMKEAKFTASQTLYTFVQCTPDLSGSDCNRCLRIAMTNLPGCCGGKESGVVLFPSCVVAYSVDPFYLPVNKSASTPNPAPVLPPPRPGDFFFSFYFVSSQTSKILKKTLLDSKMCGWFP
ncbi:cysteine-rich receptor-like protein kinase 25 [Alnus glutinosa]|uniref:cysteine-rich receptor-like protein kinase 25 n=1 Tax=Alnus glutinosa TaxID=3517 RepID=UPI002D7A1671|nr:cysteine-rich receptor-like protein kinase 25 [Alnus glutinosa]